MSEEFLSRVVVNPRVMAGKPIIKGTRITVEQILRLLGQASRSRKYWLNTPT